MLATCSRLSDSLSAYFVPPICHQVSAIEQESIDIDPDTKDLLDALDFKDLAGIAVSAVPARI